MHQTDVAMFAITDDRPTAFAWAMDGDGGAAWNAATVKDWLKSGRSLLLRHKDDADTNQLFDQIWSAGRSGTDKRMQQRSLDR